MAISNKHIADKKLIKALKKGKHTAFKKIFHKYESHLYRFIFFYTKSEFITEEIIQEIFMKIWTERKKLNPKLSFHSYIFKFAKNRTFNYLRNAAKRESVKSELWNNLSEQYEHIESDLLFSEYQEIVDNIIETLPKTRRSIYILSKQQGKSHTEIATLLGIQIQTVKNNLSKVKKMIKAQLRPHLENGIRLFLLYCFC